MYENGSNFGVSIQMSFDKLILERTVYRYSDLFNDIGGILGFMEMLVHVVLPLISGWSLETHLVSILFKTSQKNGSEDCIEKLKERRPVKV
jgi:hypothetical protein